MSNPANIFLNLQNTTNSVQQVSLFNPNPGLTGTGQGSVISTQYSANVSSLLNNGNTLYLSAKLITETSYTTYTVQNTGLAQFTSVQQIVDALNTLNFGTFSILVNDANTITNFNNNYNFNTLAAGNFNAATIEYIDNTTVGGMVVQIGQQGNPPAFSFTTNTGTSNQFEIIGIPLTVEIQGTVTTTIFIDVYENFTLINTIIRNPFPPSVSTQPVSINNFYQFIFRN